MSGSRREINFGTYLRRAREAAKVSQAELARAIGVTPSSLSRVECVATNINEGTVRRYAAALACRVELVLIPEDDDA